jgi:membrane-associated phospholipid phosphatase
VRLRRVVALASPVAFVLLARRAALGKVSAGEERVFRLVNKSRPQLRRPAWVVMQAGSLAAVPVTAVLAVRKHRATALALAIDGTAVWAFCKLIKRFVKRGRPVDCLDDVVITGKAQRGSGFPSGHAAVATTLTVIGARLLPRPASQLAWVVPVLVGAGRQLVGAHLPLDVAGGAALGVTAGSLANIALDVI